MRSLPPRSVVEWYESPRRKREERGGKCGRRRWGDHPDLARDVVEQVRRMAGEREGRVTGRGDQPKLDRVRRDAPDVLTLVVEKNGHRAAPDDACGRGAEAVVLGGLDRRPPVFQ